MWATILRWIGAKPRSQVKLSGETGRRPAIYRSSRVQGDALEKVFDSARLGHFRQIAAELCEDWFAELDAELRGVWLQTSSMIKFGIRHRLWIGLRLNEVKNFWSIFRALHGFRRAMARRQDLSQHEATLNRPIFFNSMIPSSATSQKVRCSTAAVTHGVAIGAINKRKPVDCNLRLTNSRRANDRP